MKKPVVLVIALLAVALIVAAAVMLLNEGEEEQAFEETTATETVQQSEAVETNTYTTAEVTERNSAENCWTIIDGNVYDLTTYIDRHPGGDKILEACGVDGSRLFNNRETDEGEVIGSGSPHSNRALSALAKLQIGTLE